MGATSTTKGQPIADGAGLFASVACAIHCAAMPLAISYLPMLGLGWLADESFHQVMAAVCFVLAASAFIPGWRKHRSLAPAFVGLAGVGLLAVAAFWLEGECCPSCAASIDMPSPELTCGDEKCLHCVPAQQKPSPKEIDIGAPAARTLPLITPLGGLMLVAGHLLNHRKSCQCSSYRCCINGPEPRGA